MLLLSAVLFLAYKAWRAAENTAQLSCIASIAADLDQKLQTKELNIKSRELSKEEILTLLNNKKGHDCGGMDNTLFNNLHVLIDKRGQLEKVWTDGYDGISGTSDDIVVP